MKATLPLTLLLLAAAGLCIPGASAQVDATNNLALGRPVAASSSVEFPPNWTLTNPVDGNREGGSWSTDSEFADPDDSSEFYVVDLENVFTIDQLVLYPRVHGGAPLAHFPLDFNIMVSTDSTVWTEALSVTDYPAAEDSEGEIFDFDPVEARYVRLDFLEERANEAGTEYRAQFAELEIYPADNLALGRPVSATSSVDAPPNWSITNPVDGVVDGGAWSTNSENGDPDDSSESYVVDLGDSLRFDKVVLYPRVHGNDPFAHFPLDFEIQTSTDSTDWTTLLTVEDYPAPSDSDGELFEFDETGGRYVRLNFLEERANEAGTEYRAQFAEIQIGLFAFGGGVSTEPGSGLPGGLALRGNYPNPFAGTTTVRFDLPTQAEVSVEVYDLLGRRVLRSAPQVMAAGDGQSVTLDAATMAAGLYVYRVVAHTADGVLTQTRRMTVMK